MSEYRVEFYDNNPLTPYEVQFLTRQELIDLIHYYRSLYSHHSRRKLGHTVYYDFWNTFDNDELYLVIYEL